MTEDFVKEIIEGAGADDPELKTYRSQVRAIAAETRPVAA